MVLRYLAIPTVPSADPPPPPVTDFMPAGALGIWYMDQYSATPTPHVPNAMAVNPVPANIWRATRRLFGSQGGGFWQGNSCTITDRNALDDEGLMQASTLVAGGNGWYMDQQTPRQTLTPGKWTIDVKVKRNTGTDQTFRLAFFSQSLFSAVKTATDTWQRHYLTTTVVAPGDPYPIPLFNDGSGGASLQFSDVRLYPGDFVDVDTDIEGHMYLGHSHTDTATLPVVTTPGALNFNGGPFGSIQLPGEPTVTTSTVIAMAKMRDDAASNFQGLLSGIKDWAAWSVLGKTDGRVETIVTGTNSRIIPMWVKPMGVADGWHMVAIIHGAGDVFEVWVDDVRIGQTFFGSVPGLPVPTRIIADLFASRVQTTPSGYEFAALAFYNRACTVEEMRSAYAVLRDRAAEHSIVVAPHQRVLCAEGDSITFGTNATSGAAYADVYAKTTANIYFGNYAVNASQVANANARAFRLDGVLQQDARNYVMTVKLGSNDLNNVSAASFLASLQAYVEARKTAGWTVGVCTILPATMATTSAGFEAKRQTANTAIRTWAGNVADFVIDLAAEATMGASGAENNTALYVDGIHPTDAGHLLLKAVYKTAVDAVLLA